MAVRVIRDRSTQRGDKVDTFEKANVIVVRDGVLFVSEHGRNDAADTIATYAAGSWMSAERDS